MRAVVVVACALAFLSACNKQRERPRETQIEPAAYMRMCRANFEKDCQGKFIIFDGVVRSADGNTVRIKGDYHGFDVKMLAPLSSDAVGSRVRFSGFLLESHTFNDDVNDGVILDVIATKEVVAAAEARIQKEREEAEAKTCRKNWTMCKSNQEMASEYEDWIRVQFMCKRAVENAVRYGKPTWADSWGSMPFDRTKAGDDFARTGIAVLGDNEVKLQNGFGVYGRSQVRCTYDLRNQKVFAVNID